MMLAIALLLPDVVERELEMLREDHKRHMTYISIPHVTLVYPFAAAGLSADVVLKLEAIATRTPPVTMALDSVRFFDSTRVAYLGIGDSQSIADLRKTVMGCLQDIEEEAAVRDLGYTPHVSIGAAIPADAYPLVKAALSEQTVSLNATAESFGLFTDGGENRWAVARRFMLRGRGKGLDASRSLP